jgi:hypothetical protein
MKRQWVPRAIRQCYQQSKDDRDANNHIWNPISARRNWGICSWPLPHEVTLYSVISLEISSSRSINMLWNRIYFIRRGLKVMWHSNFCISRKHNQRNYYSTISFNCLEFMFSRLSLSQISTIHEWIPFGTNWRICILSQWIEIYWNSIVSWDIV